MLDIDALKSLLEPIPDAAVGVAGDVICLMNQAAKDLAGDKSGEHAAALLPQEVLGMDAGGIADAVIAGVRVCIQKAAVGDVSVYYLSRAYDRGALNFSEAERERSALFSELTTLVESVRTALQKLEYADGEAREAVSRAMHASCTVSRMLTGGAAVEAIEKGDVVLNRERVSASGMLADIVSTIRFFAQPRGIEVKLGSDGSVEGVFDAYWTQVALFNLLSHCLMRLGEGGTVTLNVLGAQDRVTFTIDAEGPSSGKSGDERGLKIARAIAAMHGGTCISNIAPEGGAHLRVSLPAEEEPSDSLRAAGVSYGRPDSLMVLTQLSAWLKDSDYDPRLLD